MRPTVLLTTATAFALAGALRPVPLPAQARDREAGVGRDTARWVDQCEHDWGGDDERARHCEVRDTRLRPSDRSMDIDGRENGGVAIIGWGADSVFLRAYVQTQAPTDAEAKEIASQIRVVTDGGRVRAEGPATHGRRSWAVSYELFVPRRFDVTATTTNGPVSVRDVAGRLQLSAVNGPIVLDGAGGDVRARAQNGPLTIDLSGTKWDGAGLDAETVNGPVSLRVPDGYSARLETGTENGPMRVDFPVTVQGRIGRRVETTLGNGGAAVRAVTTNGPVVVRKG